MKKRTGKKDFPVSGSCYGNDSGSCDRIGG